MKSKCLIVNPTNWPYAELCKVSIIINIFSESERNMNNDEERKCFLRANRTLSILIEPSEQLNRKKRDRQEKKHNHWFFFEFRKRHKNVTPLFVIRNTQTDTCE